MRLYLLFSFVICQDYLKVYDSDYLPKSTEKLSQPNAYSMPAQVQKQGTLF
jgi:hypothetical protein